MEGERTQGKREGIFERWKPCLIMVLNQAFVTGMVILSKIAISEGMYVFSLLTYRSIFGALAIIPFAFFLERGGWKSMNLKSLIWISFNAFIGYAVAMALYCYGLNDTTPSYSVIFLNIIPIATMETLKLFSLQGGIKILGSLLCFGGTLLVSLYKGRALHMWPSLVAKHQKTVKTSLVGAHPVRGTLFLSGSCFAYACWYLLQSKVLKVYPFKYWSSMMTCLMGGIQTGLLGVILKRDKKSWRLGWDMQLLTVVYSGIFATAAKYTMNSYVVEKRGPSYPSMFNALSVVFTIISDSLFMNDDITVGSLIGTILIIGGLYLFLWGRQNDGLVGKEEEDESNNNLQNGNEELEVELEELSRII